MLHNIDNVKTKQKFYLWFYRNVFWYNINSGSWVGDIYWF